MTQLTSDHTVAAEMIDPAGERTRRPRQLTVVLLRAVDDGHSTAT